MANRSINDIYNLMSFIVRKERGIFLTIPEAMSNLDAGQLEKYEEDFKSYKTNQTISDSLSVFKITNLQFTSAADGSVAFPDDYIHFLEDLFTVTGSTVNKVTLFNEDEKADHLTNQLRQISTSNPYYENTDPGFQLYPQTQQTGFYSYLRRPAIPFLDYTLSGTDNRTVTYNPAGSTQLEWRDNYIDNIIARALAYSGVFMNEDGVIKFSQLKQQQTES